MRRSSKSVCIDFLFHPPGNQIMSGRIAWSSLIQRLQFSWPDYSSLRFFQHSQIAICAFTLVLWNERIAHAPKIPVTSRMDCPGKFASPKNDWSLDQDFLGLWVNKVRIHQSESKSMTYINIPWKSCIHEANTCNQMVVGSHTLSMFSKAPSS